MSNIFTYENITLINADCMSVMAAYGDKYFDLAWPDVPYGIKEDGRKARGRAISSKGIIKKIDKRNGRDVIVRPKEYEGGLYDDKQPEQTYFDELFRTSKKQIIWGCNYLRFDQKETCSGRIFWDKINYTSDYSDGELAWTNMHNGIRQIEYMWNGMLQSASLSNGRKYCGKPNNELKIHPNHKPVNLYLWLLKNYAKPTDKILDTHGGSFSSAIAAHRFGCKEFIGIELDEDYFKAAVKRFKQQVAQLDMFQTAKKGPQDIEQLKIF